MLILLGFRSIFISLPLSTVYEEREFTVKLCSQLARGRGTLAVHAPPNARSAFHKKQQSESYLARATPSSTNFLTPPVKVTGMYADTRLIRAENSNMLEVPFRRVSVRMAPQKPAKIRTNAWFQAYTRQL